MQEGRGSRNNVYKRKKQVLSVFLFIKGKLAVQKY